MEPKATCFKYFQRYTFILLFLKYLPMMNSLPQIKRDHMYSIFYMQNRSTEGCSKLKRSVDITSSGKNGLNIRTNASPKWDRTRFVEQSVLCLSTEDILLLEHSLIAGICQGTFEIVAKDVLWSVWGSYQTISSPPLPNVTRHSG